MLVSTAFFLGLLLGGFILVVTLIYDEKTTKECPVCKQAKELQEKEEALRKEWKDQQTGYKN